MLWTLLLRQHEGTKPKAVIMWVFLRSPVSIFCIFLNGMPPAGQQLPIKSSPLASNLYSPRGGIYIFALCCISSRQPSENSSNAMQREGWGRGTGLGGISPYRCEWHHLPSFPLAGQQHLCHHNEMTGLNHLLGPDNEARSLSCTGEWRLLAGTWHS